MEPLSIALGLAKFVPDIVGWVAGDKAEEAADKVVDIATKLTGAKPEDVVEVIAQDPTTALEFHKACMEDKHVLDRLALDNIKDARAMYRDENETADKIAQRIIDWNLPIIGLLIIALGALAYFLNDIPGLDVTLGAIIGGAITQLFKERQDITGFYFGSSIGNEMQTKEKRLNAGG